MPTYEDLRSYLDESEALQELIRGATKFPIVTGFTLDLDKVWARIYDALDGIDGWPSGVKSSVYNDAFIAAIEHWPAEYVEQVAALAFDTEYQGFRKRDLHRHLPPWDQFCRGSVPAGSARLPVVLTIVHRPVRAPDDGQVTPPDQEMLRGLIAHARSGRVLVRVEERPRARLASASSRITNGIRNVGTLGGALYDRGSGRAYGVTCDHVATAGDTVYGRSRNEIGKCRHSTARVRLPGQQVCDPVVLPAPVPSPGNGPSVNMLDCALIELTAALSRVPLGRILTGLTPGQNVVLNGSETGVSHHKLGSLCLSYQFGDGDHLFCFKDVIELRPRPWIPIGGALGQTFAKMPTQGDSGAWVVTDDSPADWAAMFFGEDGYRAFGIRASWIHRWAETASGTTLSL